MFYIVSSENVGPNVDPNSNCFWVTKNVPVTNCGGNARHQGWLGTTNDMSLYAHGCYDTLEDAESEIKRILKDEGWRIDTLDDWNDVGIEVRYLAGTHERLSKETSWEMCWITREEVFAHTLDETIRDLVEADARMILRDFEQELDQEAVFSMLQEYRDELLSEKIDDDGSASASDYYATDRACAEDETLNNAFEAGRRIGAIEAFLFINTKYSEQSCENRTIESVLWDCKAEIARIKTGEER